MSQLRFTQISHLWHGMLYQDAGYRLHKSIGLTTWRVAGVENMVESSSTEHGAAMGFLKHVSQSQQGKTPARII